MTAVVISRGLHTQFGTTHGVIAGEAPGIVTLDNVPGVAVIDLFRRSDNAWLRRTYSAINGTYRFSALALGVQHDLVGRDLTNTWDDVIVGRVLPFTPLKLLGNAPNCAIGIPYSYAYTVIGGEAPITFTLDGDLPDGLSLVATDTTLHITGTPTADAVDQSFVIEAEDVREATATLVDSVAVNVAGARRYWRLVVTHANGYLSIGEIEMAATAGGPDQCVGGVASASSQYWGMDAYGASKAFDDDLENAWISNEGLQGWIGYTFPEPVAVRELRICPRTTDAQSPNTWTLQSSEDGETWEVKGTYTGITAWTFHAMNAFAVPV